MAYRTLMTVATDRDLARAVVPQAAELAGAFDAHLDVLALGVDRMQTGYYYAGANAVVLQETLTRAATEARDLGEATRALCETVPVRWSVEEAVAQMADLWRHVGARARFADLVVLPKPFGEGHGIELEPVLEGALFHGQAPVMVLPGGPAPAAQPGIVAVAWNESAEAMRAVRAALPILTAARAVHVVVVDPPVHGPERSDPGGMLAQFLSRHGVKTEIDVLSRTVPRVADVLSRHCIDIGAELLVMGAYGHSRFREAILGGATRDMLEGAKMPVLMAH